MTANPAIDAIAETETGFSGRVAVVDIGSNTVRLVVYDTPTRLPIPIFNEKAECGLVRGMEESGLLNPEGTKEAFRSLNRFALLSRSMGVEHMALIATAAVREASDGPAFVDRVTNEFGLEVRVLTGDEEARLSALGLLAGRPHVDGLLVDIGGGSVDIIELNRGRFGRSGTLPLGHLRLMEAAEGNVANAVGIVDAALETMPWLADLKGRNLFFAGGSCRALARVFIGQEGYPLHVIDGFKVRRADARRLCNVIAALGPDSLTQISELPKGRRKTLPFTATVVGALLATSQAKKAVFSGYGMREGQLLELLPESIRRQDPLLSGCAGMAERTGRFSITGEEIYDWMAPLFPKKRDAESRLRMAACMLSDIGWSEHPDYRAEHAFLRVLRLPFAGLSHHDRVFLALTIFVRYKGDPRIPAVAPIRPLLQENDLDRAETIGDALRLAHTLSGSAPGLLPMTTLTMTDGDLVLTLSGKLAEDRDIFSSEAVERRLSKLAKSLGRVGRLA